MLPSCYGNYVKDYDSQGNGVCGLCKYKNGCEIQTMRKGAE